jgi:hypothetical protein
LLDEIPRNVFVGMKAVGLAERLPTVCELISQHDRDTSVFAREMETVQDAIEKGALHG